MYYVKDHMLISFDILHNRANKNYNKININNSLFQLLDCFFCSDNHMYELLPADQPVKLYFDSEMVQIGFTKEKCYYLLELFKKWLQKNKYRR